MLASSAEHNRRKGNSERRENLMKQTRREKENRETK
jgi:hypothetical protein